MLGISFTLGRGDIEEGHSAISLWPDGKEAVGERERGSFDTWIKYTLSEKDSLLIAHRSLGGCKEERFATSSQLALSDCIHLGRLGRFGQIMSLLNAG